MRMSLATSEERAVVDEKAYIVYVRKLFCEEIERTHASKAGAWLAAEEGEHVQVQERVSRSVTSLRAASP